MRGSETGGQWLRLRRMVVPGLLAAIVGSALLAGENFVAALLIDHLPTLDPRRTADAAIFSLIKLALLLLVGMVAPLAVGAAVGDQVGRGAMRASYHRRVIAMAVALGCGAVGAGVFAGAATMLFAMRGADGPLGTNLGAAWHIGVLVLVPLLTANPARAPFG